MRELTRFSLFFANGVAIGLFCWGLQLVLFRLMPSSGANSYFSASALAYAVSVLINFAIQERVIFGRRGSFARFAGISVFMTALVSALSVVIRSAMAPMLGYAVADSLGFALAAVASAPVSYLLVSRIAFRS